MLFFFFFSLTTKIRWGVGAETQIWENDFKEFTDSLIVQRVRFAALGNVRGSTKRLTLSTLLEARHKAHLSHPVMKSTWCNQSARMQIAEVATVSLEAEQQGADDGGFLHTLRSAGVSSAPWQVLDQALSWHKLFMPILSGVTLTVSSAWFWFQLPNPHVSFKYRWLRDIWSTFTVIWLLLTTSSF